MDERKEEDERPQCDRKRKVRRVRRVRFGDDAAFQAECDALMRLAEKLRHMTFDEALKAFSQPPRAPADCSNDTPADCSGDSVKDAFAADLASSSSECPFAPSYTHPWSEPWVVDAAAGPDSVLALGEVLCE